MNEEEQKPAAPADQPAQTPAPVSPQDRISRNEAISKSVYPDPDKPKPVEKPLATATAETRAEQFRFASAAMNESLTLMLGLAASISYLLTGYFIKSTWATIAISGALAVFAIYFAVVNYRSNGKMTPFMVVGLSAATIALVSAINILFVRFLVNSIISY